MILEPFRWMSARNIAPVNEFYHQSQYHSMIVVRSSGLTVAPDENVLIGAKAAAAASMIVPSFCVKYSGQFKPSSLMAFWNPWMVFRANFKMLPFKIAAFSRSTKPTRPMSFEHTTSMPGISCRRICWTCSSCVTGAVSRGEKIPTMTTVEMPSCRIVLAWVITSSGLTGLIDLPSTIPS